MNLDDKTVSQNIEQQGTCPIEELFVMYQKPIYQFVYRYCQDEQLCLDLVQDTFIRFQKYQNRFDGKKSTIKTYLFRMAYQLMINRLKRRSRLVKIMPFLYIQSQEQHTLTYEDKLTVQSAILQLPDEQRAVILLTYYHDMTQREVADILAIPTGTVKSRLHASLKKLKVLLEVNE
ncbi:RNA polymerase sigma factor [Oceanobacillus sp. FSL H7-0719]|uniref:RNA polymerase sigma factor n=1 Tax=Oceanobacillus sp. FSL H7-0719 TaxID=2954507 RepID=UPI0032431802